MSLDKLRSDCKNAERQAQKLMAEKDQAIEKVRARYAQRLQTSNDKAAAAQKALLDAEVLASLQDRPDGHKLAQELARQGALSGQQVKAAFPDDA